MGTTLTNGIYLPNEGEKNCYAGLKTNWETLDQKIADIAALQQAVAGALHREIVENLPTTDIDPNTIYMVLSGTSATENVYDEYMYVNNAWELIGTSATDLTNYYTKGDVDGLLLLKANASDLTSHTGDTTIHVTASDKTKWTNSANTHVLRLALSALTPSTSDNSFSNLDDSTALKVGDKVMDTAGVLFEVTAIDTANSTFTIGTSLIDLAQDSDVLHKSGNETVAGQKTFSDTATFVSVNVEDIRWKSLANQTVDLNDCYIPRAGAISGYYTTDISSGANISNKVPNTAFTMISLTTRRISASDYQVRQVFYGSGAKYIRTCANGTWTAWVNEVDKFVTTDTNQTISGSKTFSSNVNVYNSDATATTPNLYLRSSKIEISSQGNTSGDQNLTYLDKNNTTYAYVKGAIQSNGSAVKIRSVAKDSSDNSVVNELQILANTNGRKIIFPTSSNEIELGDSSYKWKSFNGVEPSSLSLPSSRDSRVDISSYITNLGNGNNNSYTVPANGYIWLHFTSINSALCYSQTPGGLTNYAQTFARNQGDGQLYAFFPVRKDDTFVVQIYTSSTAVVQNAYFIPCQGNV